jgi:hypothetical protein
VPRGHLPANPAFEQSFLAQDFGMIGNTARQHQRHKNQTEDAHGTQYILSSMVRGYRQDERYFVKARRRTYTD